jgi:hypothetical protein
MPGAAILWRIFSWLITAVNALLRRSIEAVGVPAGTGSEIPDAHMTSAAAGMSAFEYRRSLPRLDIA